MKLNTTALLNSARFNYQSSDPRRTLKFFLVVAFFVLVIFGLFGMHLSLASLKVKRAELETLKDREKVLQDKKFQLVDADSAMRKTKDIIPLLNTAIPSEDDTHVFMSELVEKVSFEGYIPSNLDFYKTDDRKMSAALRFEGDPSEMYKVVNVLENLSRLTVVTYMHIVTDDPALYSRIETAIFKVSETPLDLSEALNCTIDVEFLKKEFKPAL